MLLLYIICVSAVSVGLYNAFIATNFSKSSLMNETFKGKQSY